MLIWGKNNNHLFKNNHKKTFSLPQHFQITKQILHCACGYDFIAMITKEQKIIFQYQSAFYETQLKGMVDVQTYDGTMVFVKKDGNAWICQFNAEKIITNDLRPSKIYVKDKIKKVFMNYGDIYLQGEKELYHMKRNDWYQTKTYSDPTQIQTSNFMTKVCPGPFKNYFLSQNGVVYESTKAEPTKIVQKTSSHRYKDICVNQWFVGVSVDGELFVEEQSEGKSARFAEMAKLFEKVFCNSQNNFAITKEGQIWAWGVNSSGQLGVSDYQVRQKPYPLVIFEGIPIFNIFQGEGYTVCFINDIKKYKSNLPNKKTKNIQHLTNQQVFSFELNKDQNNKLKQNSIIKTPIKESKEKSLSVKKDRSGRKNISKQNINLNKKAHIKAVSLLTPTAKTENSIRQLKSPYFSKSARRSPLKSIYNKNASVKSFKKSQTQPRKNDNDGLMEQLKKENIKLRKIIENKDQIIEEVTTKIRILEDAIDQFEKISTHRDQIIDQYNNRQQKYQHHIFELQKSIDEIKNANSNIEVSQKEFKDKIIFSLQSTYHHQIAKQKQFFIDQLNLYDQQLKEQRNEYETKIQQLAREVEKLRMSNFNKLDSIQKDTKIQQITNRNVEDVIMRIQSNKEKIDYSARKLVKLLQ